MSGRDRRAASRCGWSCPARPPASRPRGTARAASGCRGRGHLRHGRHQHRRLPDHRTAPPRPSASGRSTAARCALPSVAVESDRRGRRLDRLARRGRRPQGRATQRRAPCPARPRYGLGGTEPTVTRRQRVLGYPHRTGVWRRVRSARRRAREAAARRIAEPLGLSRRRGRARHRRGGQREHAARAPAGLRAARLRPARLHADRLRRRRTAARRRARAQAPDPARRRAGHTPSAFSALGCLVSPLRYDAVQTLPRPARARDAEERRGPASRAWSRSAWRRCCARAIRAERDRVRRSVDLRYAGQNYELEVAWRGPAGPERPRTASSAGTGQLYGYATGERVECVNLRVSRARAADRAARSARAASRRHRGPRRRSTARVFPGPARSLRDVYGRAGLRRRRADRGPGPDRGRVVDDVLVYPVSAAAADRLGNLLIEVARA